MDKRKQFIKQLSNKYGDTFYLLDSDRVEKNYNDLLESLNSIFPHFKIAYSYKTNYIPQVCKLINSLGGYAEVVSDMEYFIAHKIGVKVGKIVFNGPYKRLDKIVEFLKDGGCLNIDNLTELEKLHEVGRFHNIVIPITIRCNFSVNNGVVSRFGIDVESEDFIVALRFIEHSSFLQLVGLHSHIANRSLRIWREKVLGISNVIKRYKLWDLQHIDIGGGLYGNMPLELKKQFSEAIPNFKEYAEVIAPVFADLYKGRTFVPTIFVEPGSALVGDAMSFICRVDSIKDIRGTKIATLTGSMYNINPTLNHKNPPVHIVSNDLNETCEDVNELIDMAGFTCIESDYLYRGYNGVLHVNDLVVFDNVGSYSVVLKPPFILPNYPVVNVYKGEDTLVKDAETFEYLFSTYKF